MMRPILRVISILKTTCWKEGKGGLPAKRPKPTRSFDLWILSAGICQFRHVAKSGNSFTVIFYGPKAFLRKTAQFLSMQCKSNSSGFPMKSTLCNAVKTCAKSFS